jgi:hypothetical protein
MPYLHKGKHSRKMTSLWKEARCASIPVESLPLLADLRGRPEIRVSIAGAKAWVRWEPDSELMQTVLVRRILPLPEVELFTERGGRFYRLGEHLPAFDVPIDPGSPGVSLDRIMVPVPIEAQPPTGIVPDPLSVRLVRDDRGLVRPASALRCPLAVFGSWAESATRAQLERLRGVTCGGSGGADAAAEILVLGNPGALPLLAGGVRFWGTDVFIPLGYRTDPDLPEPAILNLVGAGAGDLAIFDHDGYELVARGLFKPLCRAAIRLGSPVRNEAGPIEGNSK